MLLKVYQKTARGYLDFSKQSHLVTFSRKSSVITDPLFFLLNIFKG